MEVSKALILPLPRLVYLFLNFYLKNIISRLVFVFSLMFCGVVLATQPGDEAWEANNNFCKYEKYKGRMPGACPRVNEIIYGLTVYENRALENNIKLHLLETLSLRKSKSKHNHIALTLGRSWILSNTKNFEQIYAYHPINEKQLAIDFMVRIVPEGDKYVVFTTAFLRSNKLFNSAQEISDAMLKDDIEVYVEGLIDTHLKYYFFPKVFPDSI